MAERRVKALRCYPFYTDEAIQDLSIHRATNWLLETYSNDSQQQKERPSNSGRDSSEYILELAQSIALPLLAVYSTGSVIDLDTYYRAQRSLATIQYNVNGMRHTLGTLRSWILPFADTYLRAVEMENKRSKSSDEMVKCPRIDSLELKSVSFAYNSSAGDADTKEEGKETSWALADFNFCFETGKVYSVVGKNGSGKSTLVNILTKLFHPSVGQILVNGTDVTSVPKELWLDQVAVVPQEGSDLWDFSIGENISFGSLATSEEVEEEAQRCGVTDFVKLDTFYGDSSQSVSVPGFENETWVADFSGGQWQAMALARGFLRASKARLFILDEPSSSLDPEREHDLFERLRNEKDARITIFISHSLKTCRASDCILVMDNGRIIESGTHAELVGEKDGVYWKLYEMQNETWHDEEV